MVLHQDFIETLCREGILEMKAISQSMELIMVFARTLTGNDSDNFLRGDNRAERFRGRAGNDIVEALGGNDQLLGGKNDDYLFGGLGSDTLSGDDDLTLGDGSEKGNDILIGGSGSDRLIGWGDDILVGSGSNTYNAGLIDSLKNDPFQTPIIGDGQRDTFVALNKQGIDYTLTIADYEQQIDQIDLRSFGITSGNQFSEIQDKGGWYEAIAPEVNNAQLVLRININPTDLTYVI
jgi:Ca2+-binding RTX toxin-like protein